MQVRSDDPDTPSLYVALTGVGGPSTADTDGDGYSPAEGDCDDGSTASHPGAAETCDGRDNDCDGSVPADEADVDAAVVDEICAPKVLELPPIRSEAPAPPIRTSSPAPPSM